MAQHSEGSSETAILHASNFEKMEKKMNGKGEGTEATAFAALWPGKRLFRAISVLTTSVLSAGDHDEAAQLRCRHVSWQKQDRLTLQQPTSADRS